MPASTLHTVLGLPPPAGRTFSDPMLSEAYAGFIEQLTQHDAGRVILTDPQALSLGNVPESADQADEWWSALEGSERATLFLLSLLGRPFDASRLSAADSRWLIGDEDFARLWISVEEPSLAKGREGTGLGLDTLLARRDRGRDPAVEKLIQQVPRRSAIVEFRAEFIGDQPGNYGLQMWQIARWSSDYAIVFAVTDPTGDGYPFPWILGFCAMEGLERNFLTLLREGASEYDAGFYASFGAIQGDWPLARLALTADPESDGTANWDAIDALGEFERPELEALLAVNGLLDSREAIVRLHDVLALAEDVLADSTSLRRLLEEAGAGLSLSSFEAWLRQGEDS